MRELLLLLDYLLNTMNVKGDFYERQIKKQKGFNIRRYFIFMYYRGGPYVRDIV